MWRKVRLLSIVQCMCHYLDRVDGHLLSYMYSPQMCLICCRSAVSDPLSSCLNDSSIVRPSDIMRWKIGNYAAIQSSLCGKLCDFLILILWYYTWSKGKKTPLYALTKILSAIIKNKLEFWTNKLIIYWKIYFICAEIENYNMKRLHTI